MEQTELILESIEEAQRLIIQGKFGESLDILANTACSLSQCNLGFFARYDSSKHFYIVESAKHCINPIPSNSNLVEGLTESQPFKTLNQAFEFSKELVYETVNVSGLYADGILQGIFVLAGNERKIKADQWPLIKSLLSTGLNFIHQLIFKELVKRNHNLLVDNEVRYNSLLENLVDAIITINEHGLIESFNNSAERMFAYQRHEVMGKNVKMLMPDPYRSEHDDYIHNYISTNNAKIIGYGRAVHGLRKDGHIFPIDLAVGEMTIKGRKMFTGIARDITDRRLAEQKSRENALRLKAVVENVVDGIVTIDADGNIQSLNSAAEELFGYKREELLGKNVKMLMPEPYQSEHGSYLRNYLDTKKAKVIGIGREVVGLRKDGSVFPMDLAVGEVELEGERLFTGIIRDITERKRVEKMKSEFISTVSHELRTPLTSIKGALGLLCSGILGKVPGEAQNMLNIASNNTQRLLLLINDILDMQKIESNNMVFRFNVLELNKFIKKILLDSCGLEKEMNIRFEFAETTNKTMVFADKDRLMQVLYNLMSNAAKFSPEGEIVTLSINLDNGLVRITVEDHGPGVPDEFRPKLFEKFTQLDSSDTRKMGGTGLGLSICKLIMEKHGGIIGYRPTKSGSIFYIELPELITNMRLIKSKNIGGGSRVLIVEDDPQIAMVIQNILGEMGVESDIAFSATQARECLLDVKKNYQCLILDIILPGESGISLLRDIRANSIHDKLSIIVLSIKADEVRHEMGDEFKNILAWFNKPLDIEKFKKVFEKLLGNSKKILHVEDDKDLYEVVRDLVGEKYEVDWAGSLKIAKKRVSETSYDLILLDLGLPDGVGSDLIHWLKKEENDTKVIVFTADEKMSGLGNESIRSLVKSKTSNAQLLENIDSAINNG